MARISETKGRDDDNSGYVRLLGNNRLGHLISQTHATVIRTGNQLERDLEAATPTATKATLLDATARATSPGETATQVVFSPQAKKEKGAPPGVKGDVVVFDHTNRRLLVIEVKDGDTFDTKKASGELESMSRLASILQARTNYTPSIFFCSFNQESKEAIAMGAKGRFSLQQVMTGRELCGILGIDYDLFRANRQAQQAENFEYFLSQIAAIPEARSILARKLA